MSQNFQYIREPKFCFCIPLAKGVCCGLISLKTALIIISVLDIVAGGAAIGIGISAFVKFKLEISLAAYVLVNGISLILACFCLYAI